MKYLYLSIFIVIIGYFNLVTPVVEIVRHVVSPFGLGFREIALDAKGTLKFFSGVNSIREENLKLLQENLDLRSQIASLKYLEEENALLRSQLHVKDTIERDFVSANTMGNSSDLTGSSFFIDKGSINGVSLGDNIISGKYLVGVVRKVERYRSLADYITSPSVSMTVENVSTPYKTQGLGKGQYSSSVLVSRILPGEIIRVGDVMTTSGKDGLFIPGLIVGSVTEIVENPAEPLKSAFLSTYLDLYKIRKVFVLVN